MPRANIEYRPKLVLETNQNQYVESRSISFADILNKILIT